MDIGVFARVFERTSLSNILDAARERGFTLVHFSFRALGMETLPGEIDDDLCREVRQAFESRGIRMAGVSATYNLIHPRREYRAEQTLRACRLIRSAPALGTRLVTLSTGTNDPDDMWKAHPANESAQSWSEMRSSLDRLLAAAEEANVKLGIEPEPGNVVSSARCAHRLLEEVDSPQLVVIFDPVNLLAHVQRSDGAQVLEEALAILADRIEIVHAKHVLHARVNWDGLGELLERHGVSAPILIHDVPESELEQVRALVERSLARAAPRSTFEWDGIRFGWQSSGQGKPLLLLHGLGGDRTQAFDLAPPECGRRIAIDLRAHGDTWPVGGSEAFSFETFANDVGAFADSLNLGRFALAGVSMGAGVALRYALENPARVRELVLVRPAWIERPLTENLLPFVDVARLLRERGVSEGQRAFEDSEQCHMVRAVSTHAATSLLAQFTKPHARERAVRLERMPASTPYHAARELKRLDPPALVIGSDRDPLHPFAFAEQWSRALPQGRLRSVVSKDESIEEHEEAIRKEVQEFLAEHD